MAAKRKLEFAAPSSKRSRQTEDVKKLDVSDIDHPLRKMTVHGVFVQLSPVRSGKKSKKEVV